MRRSRTSPCARCRPRFLALGLAGVGAAALATAACAGRPPSGAPLAAGAPEGLAELEALYRARQDSALRRFSEADAAFMARMIPHHEQALVMARLVPARSASPVVRALAARIVDGQQDEIATMRRWLEARGLGAPATGPDGAALDHAGHAPGMLTAEELSALERSSGRDFDRLFLSLMIRHHEGAVVMVEELFATDRAAEDPFVFRIASDVQVDQRTEIQRMRLMLEELDGSVPSPGGPK